MLSFRTMLDPARARGVEARIGFRLGAESYLARLAKGRFNVARAHAAKIGMTDAEVTFTGAPTALAAAVYGGVALKALIAKKAMTVEGDLALAEKFVTLFPLPAKAECEH